MPCVPAVINCRILDWPMGLLRLLFIFVSLLFFCCCFLVLFRLFFIRFLAMLVSRDPLFSFVRYFFERRFRERKSNSFILLNSRLKSTKVYIAVCT